LQEGDLDKLIFPFKKHSITSLEYKPFSRFSLAKSLDEVFENKLSETLIEILNNRETGVTIIEPEINNKKFDKEFLVKLSTGLAYLVGNPNFDSMTNQYYARFTVKHEDNSDSYLRKAYTNLDLHTDGTFVKEKTDWLIMTKMEEQNVSGGESVILHLDDWEHLEEMSKDPVGQQNFIWGSPKSKNIEYKVEHPVFINDSKGMPTISYIDQFPEPKNMEQGLYLQKLSDCLEESKNKIIFPLSVGSTIFSNNYFWLHGRKPFVEHSGLSRELLRIRGTFFSH
jgi:protein CsiD